MSTISKVKYSSCIKKDAKMEKLVGDFLDETLYKRLRESMNWSIIRNTEKESQLLGIDVLIMNSFKKTYAVDEKTAVHYNGKNLDTYLCEQFIGKSDGTWKLGWGNDQKEMANSSWLLTYVDYNEETDEIQKVWGFFIEKKKWWQLAKKLGVKNSQFVLDTILPKINDSNKNEVVREIINKDIKIVYSGTKAEHPINVCINKDLLVSISKFDFVATKSRTNITFESQRKNKK